MGKKENKIEQDVVDYAKSNKFLVRKYNSPGVDGGPDRIFYGHGTIFLIEFKTLEGVLSAEQTNEISRLRKHGAKVFIVSDINTGRLVIDGAISVQSRLKTAGCW